MISETRWTGILELTVSSFSLAAIISHLWHRRGPVEWHEFLVIPVITVVSGFLWSSGWRLLTWRSVFEGELPDCLGPEGACLRLSSPVRRAVVILAIPRSTRSGTARLLEFQLQDPIDRVGREPEFATKPSDHGCFVSPTDPRRRLFALSDVPRAAAPCAKLCIRLRSDASPASPDLKLLMGCPTVVLGIV